MAVTESVTSVQRKFRTTGGETPLSYKSIPCWMEQFKSTGSTKEGRSPASPSALPWTKAYLAASTLHDELMAVWGFSLSLHCRLLWTVLFITEYFHWRERFYHKSFWTPFEHFSWLCFWQFATHIQPSVGQLPFSEQLLTDHCDPTNAPELGACTNECMLRTARSINKTSTIISFLYVEHFILVVLLISDKF
jgi:hypothetical protein